MKLEVADTGASAPDGGDDGGNASRYKGQRDMNGPASVVGEKGPVGGEERRVGVVLVPNRRHSGIGFRGCRVSLEGLHQVEAPL